MMCGMFNFSFSKSCNLRYIPSHIYIYMNHSCRGCSSVARMSLFNKTIFSLGYLEYGFAFHVARNIFY